MLVVDDSEEVLYFLEAFLQRFDVPCVKSLSGRDALKVYNKEDVGFVFLDIQLKDMSGLNVLTELKRLNDSVKVVMITGKLDKDFESRARELGVVDYITKPLDLNELKKKVNKYILEQ